jgi:PKD repeat protein
MKKFTCWCAFLVLFFMGYMLSAQNSNRKFKMEGINRQVLEINRVFTASEEIFPFGNKGQRIFGMAVTANVQLEDNESIVRILFVDRNFEEHLLYESYALLDDISSLEVDELAEETAVLNGLQAYSVKIEIRNARVELANLTYSTQMGQGLNVAELKREKKREQNLDKIDRLNKNLQVKRLGWVAGPTDVSEMSYSERKKLFGQSTFPAGFEFYSGGVISTGSESTEGTPLKSASSSMYVDNWDWRNRHGVNWMTPAATQGSCGACWSFAAVGATEALVNLFFNQQLNLDLSEQDLLSCSGGGNCNGGYPSTALNYITKTGVVDEAAFPYSGTTEPCSNKSSTPAERIKISGKIDFGSSAYPKTEDVLKQMLIELGPVSGGLYDWSHAMTLAGYQVVKEGDTIFFRDTDLKRYWKTVKADDPLIGKTVWIFKNSWGTKFGDEGYVYVETPISNFRWTHGLKTPVTSLVNDYEVICEDKDGDGYYWWGLGEKPETCDCPDEPDGDDSDPNLGPLDQYGNCMVLNAALVAAFSADNTTVNEGESVHFTDLSANNPTNWQWKFPGGVPEYSTEQHPAVTYNTPGEYDVVLTVSREGFSVSEKIRQKYITAVEDVQADYCIPLAVNSSSDYILNVTVGDALNNTSGGSGYELFAEPVILNPGQRYNVSLTPKVSSNGNFWRVWIDFNGDDDFTGTDETLVSINNKKGTVNTSLTIPANATGSTRMRVTMRNNSSPSSCDDNFSGETEDYLLSFAPDVPFVESSKEAITGTGGFNTPYGIRLYPNPAGQEVTLQLASPVQGDSYTIYTINGGKVMQDLILSDNTRIDLSGFPAGVYLVVVENNNLIYREKVVKKQE